MCCEKLYYCMISQPYCKCMIFLKNILNFLSNALYNFQFGPFVSTQFHLEHSYSFGESNCPKKMTFLLHWWGKIWKDLQMLKLPLMPSKFYGPNPYFEINVSEYDLLTIMHYYQLMVKGLFFVDSLWCVIDVVTIQSWEFKIVLIHGPMWNIFRS